MKVVVAGGGVIGAACAHYLQQSGCHVTVIDRSEFGRACSHGNCGYVCPSHVLPLAAPGAIRMALGTILRQNSPFRVKPRFDLRLWGWMYQFARRCNTADMLAAGTAIQSLLNSSRTLYDELVRKDQLECEWEERGLLFVFNTLKAFEHYAEIDQLLKDRFRMGAVRYDGPALEALEPALKPGFPGGWHYPGDAHLRPDRLMNSWRKSLQNRGVEIVDSCELVDIGEKEIRTSRGTMNADRVVIATGAWTPKLEKQLGCRIPIQPGKGYSITMPRPTICPTIPLIFEEHRVAVTPMPSGYRVGSMMEFAGYDDRINLKRVEILKQGARHYLREPLAEPIGEIWYGWRPMTPNGLPIIGRSPRHGHVWIAAGHNMLGLSMAPATGKLIAELISDSTPHLDPAPFAI